MTGGFIGVRKRFAQPLTFTLPAVPDPVPVPFDNDPTEQVDADAQHTLPRDIAVWIDRPPVENLRLRGNG